MDTFLSQPVNNEQKRDSKKKTKVPTPEISKDLITKEIQRSKIKQEIKSLNSKNKLRHKDCGDKGKICTE